MEMIPVDTILAYVFGTLCIGVGLYVFNIKRKIAKWQREHRVLETKRE